MHHFYPSNSSESIKYLQKQHPMPALAISCLNVIRWVKNGCPYWIAPKAAQGELIFINLKLSYD